MSICFFFFKQKTAYEMRISDWSSDVCSSDFDAGRRKRADGRFREHELIVKAALFLIACVASSGCDSGAAPASSETAPAYPFPELTGRVVDAATLLPPPPDARLSARLKTLQDRSHHQFVRVKVPSPRGHTTAASRRPHTGKQSR